DGDGQPDVVLLCDKDLPDRLLTAISLAERRILWEKPVVVGYEPYAYRMGPPLDWNVTDPLLLDWPVVIDLDHDGKAEGILPVGNLQGYSRWVGIEVRSGTDGEIRWQRALRKGTGHLAQCDRFIVGPDIDGDGCRDLFVASVAQEDPASGSAVLFVDALS